MKTETLTHDKKGRVRHDTAARRELIEEYKSSGLVQAEFCRARGLNPTTFNGWLRKAQQTKAGFTEVTVPVNRQKPARDNGQDGEEIEIHLANGACVWIRPGKDRKGLAKLIREVARC
jgi:transposase-like protein